MSEEKPEEDGKGEEAPKKKKPILLIAIIAIVLLNGAGVAFFLMGQSEASAEEEEDGKESKKKKKKDKKEKKEEADEEEELAEPSEVVTEVSMLPPLVIDSRDSDGNMRHVKVGLAVELGEGVAGADFDLYAPRGREAVISYLRGQTFDTLTDPREFEDIKAELEERFREAVGGKRATRVLVTEFVAQ